jgi:drug/metabolite transporter (DMT)-like permease
VNPHKEGLLAIHSAILIFGGTALFSKFIVLPALDITPLRSIFAAIVLWIFMAWQRQPLALHKRGDYLLVAVLGLLLALHWLTYFHSMQVSSVAVGVISLYTFPVITVFLEPLFDGERPGPGDVLSALSVLFGIYLMTPELSWSNATTQGVVWGVLSALLFSLRNIMQGRYFSRYPAQQSMFYQVLIVILVLIPWLTQPLGSVSVYQWWQLALLGVFFTALPHALFVHGLRFMKAKSASLIACLQVVYSTLLAFLFLAEWPGLMTLLGGAIVVTASAYETYFARTPTKTR